jgi:Bromodomain
VYIRTVPELSHGKEKNQVDSLDEPFREAHMLFQPMSISRMIKKTKENGYSSISEFVSDAKTFNHNVHVFHFG